MIHHYSIIYQKKVVARHARGPIPQSLKYSCKVSLYAKHSKLLEFIKKSIMYSLSPGRPLCPLSLSFHLPLNPEYFMNSSHQEEESKEGS